MTNVIKQKILQVNRVTNRDLLFNILTISVLYSGLFASLAKNNNHRLVFICCAFIQTMGVFSIFTKNEIGLEVVHLLMGLSALCIFFFSTSPLVNIYALFIICVIFYTRITFNGCLYYEANSPNNGMWIPEQTLNNILLLTIILQMLKIYYYI